jgi:hypothetical protein
MHKRIILFFILIIGTIPAFSQPKAKIFGTITDTKGKPIEYANISVKFTGGGTTGGYDGYYVMELQSDQEFTILFSHVSYINDSVKIKLSQNEEKRIDIRLRPKKEWIQEVTIRDEAERAKNIIRLDPKVFHKFVNTTGSFEVILKSLPGVVSNNELSSQYSVRGGNFDENLVYVNDIEIYRPFLVRSGQQEGLSFVNSDMVASVLFSAGGFEARYGDKMSSVLDIKYKKPTKSGGSFAASLLGGSAHVEGTSEDRRFTHISGIRYKTSSYLLGSLDVQGDYQPSFFDFQTYLTFDLSTNFEIDFLGHISQNKYLFQPETRETSFGTIHEALKLKIYFEGQEVNKFTTFTGALATHYRPRKNLKLSNIVSVFNTEEEETFDILGQYYLNELDNELGSDNLGDSLMNVGIGSFLNHARNYLDATVLNAYHKGYLNKAHHNIQWGAKIQHEIFYDKMNEWEMLDSAGYSLPYSDSTVNLFRTLIADTSFSSNRLSGYIQDTYTQVIDSAELSLTGGVRFNYWDFNNKLLVSPRVNVAIKPNWKRDFLFRFATGYYYQPPFFREMKDLSGSINPDIKAQQSIHFVLGSDYNFMAWNRPFKFVSEVYYKILNNLIPYDVDNVRIRYYGTNNANGYALGLDMKVNGEFVPGVDSWASFSIMSARELVEGNFVSSLNDSTIRIKGSSNYIPRPTDQFFTFGLFFQDYLPGNPSYKMQLNLLYGSGLPFGPPNSYKAIADLRVPPYRRVDIGFSRIIVGEDKILKSRLFKNFSSIWIGLEVFNLLDINNTVSYIWITDIRNQQYAVPNYLTSRRLNLKLVARI